APARTISFHPVASFHPTLARSSSRVPSGVHARTFSASQRLSRSAASLPVSKSQTWTYVLPSRTPQQANRLPVGCTANASPLSKGLERSFGTLRFVSILRRRDPSVASQT